MRLVEWTDPDGYKHLSWCKDSQPDSAAPNGLQADPPDINRLDWEEMKRDIHNQMVEQRLITWLDVQKRQNAISGIVLGIVKRNIVALYRSLEDG